MAKTPSINIPELKCDSNGEIKISDIISTINKLIKILKIFEDCCEKLTRALRIKTLREGNTLYITDDGSAPKNGSEK